MKDDNLKTPQNSVSSAQTIDKTQYGVQDKNQQPAFGDGRLAAQHGSQRNAIGWQESAQAIAASNVAPIADNKAATTIKEQDRQQRRNTKIELTKLPAIEQTTSMKLLHSRQSINYSSGFFVFFASAILATISSVGVMILYLLYYLSFMGLFIIEMFINIVLTIFGALIRIFTVIMVAILARLVPILATMAVVLGSGYFFMKSNPDLFYQIKRAGHNAAAKIHQYTGIEVPSLPEFDLFFSPDKTLQSLQGGANSLLRNMNFTVPSSFSNAFKDIEIPQELAPVMSFNQSPEMLNYFKNLIATNNLGANAQGAIPMLKQNLYSGNNALSKASKQALSNINTPDAQNILNEFEGQLKKHFGQ